MGVFLEGIAMYLHNSFGRAARLRRLFRHADGRLLIVPMDHSVTDGSIGGGVRLRRTVGDLARAGVDGVILHKGRCVMSTPNRSPTCH